MTLRLTTCLLLAVGIQSSEFHNRQGARSVIGQPSFSARDSGTSVSNLLISNGQLYAKDAKRHVLMFDLAKILARKDDLAPALEPSCTVCGFSPIAVPNQPMLQGVPGVSIHDTSVALADATNHRVLIWRDTHVSSAARAPDIVLGDFNVDRRSIRGSTLIEPISVALDGKHLFVGDAALKRVLVWNSLPTANNQPADAVLGQENFTSAETSEVPGAYSHVPCG
jgi:hypothetical protein